MQKFLLQKKADENAFSCKNKKSAMQTAILLCKKAMKKQEKADSKAKDSLASATVK